jgi:ribosomal protein S18 acetylase RimI-like enzyme
METSITFGKFRWAYYKDLRHIVINAFRWQSLSTSKWNIQLFSHVYLLGCLSLSNFSCIALLDEQPIGVILGRANSSFRQFLKSPIRLLYIVMVMLTLVFVYPNKNDRQALKTESVLERTSRKLLRLYGKPLDGELTLLALDSNHRGKGIGQSLLQSFKVFMKSQQSKDFYLYTETKISTFSFYEKQGLIVIGEEEIKTNIGNQTFEAKVMLFKGKID